MPRRGVRAEIFVFGNGAVLALVMVLFMAAAGMDNTTRIAVAGVVLLALGATLLFAIRDNKVFADTALAGFVWTAIAFVSDAPAADWNLIALYLAPTLIIVALLRLVRFAVAVPALTLALVLATGSIPSIDDFIVLVLVPTFTVSVSSLLVTNRHRIRAFTRTLLGGRLGDG